MENAPSFFVGYSWQEQYFTEALVQALQDSGLNIWAELQQLPPGSNWRPEIQKGLNSCDGLVLVVSRASLRSPYIALEWSTALKRGLPIHLVLFEEVSFEPVVIPGKNADGTSAPHTLPLDKLLKSATSITDARVNFNQAVGRLAGAMRGQSQHKDPIPAPLKFDIPSRFSPATGLIALTMSILTLAMAFTTLTQFFAYPPLLLWGALVTGWYGWNTANFVRRISYRGTRAGLFDGIVYCLLFMKWLLPLAVVAAVVMYSAKEIQRRTPTGEATQRPNSKEKAKAKRTGKGYRQASSAVDKLAARVGGLSDIAQSVISAGGVIAVLVCIVLMLASRGATSIYLLVASLTLAMAWLFFMYLRHRYGRLAVAGDALTSGITYKVLYDWQHDQVIVNPLNEVMYSAGHREPPGNRESDYLIVLLTSHFTDTAAVDKAIEAGQRVIFVLASWLTDAASRRFRKYGSYQWVDYRLQQERPLQNLAASLSVEDGGTIAAGFTPLLDVGSFRRVMLPPRVNSYLGLYRLGISFYAATALLRIVQPARFVQPQNIPAWIYSFDTLWSIVATIVGLYVCNKIIRREIAIHSIVIINLTLTVFPVCAGIVIGLLMPIPYGYERNFSGLTATCASLLFGMAIGYVIATQVLKMFLGAWLPPEMSLPRIKSPVAEWKLWAANGMMLVMLLLIVVSSIPQDPAGSSMFVRALASSPGVINQQVAAYFDSLRVRG